MAKRILSFDEEEEFKRRRIEGDTDDDASQSVSGLKKTKQEGELSESSDDETSMTITDRSKVALPSSVSGARSTFLSSPKPTAGGLVGFGRRPARSPQSDEDDLIAPSSNVTYPSELDARMTKKTTPKGERDIDDILQDFEDEAAEGGERIVADDDDSDSDEPLINPSEASKYGSHGGSIAASPSRIAPDTPEPDGGRSSRATTPRMLSSPAATGPQSIRSSPKPSSPTKTKKEPSEAKQGGDSDSDSSSLSSDSDDEDIDMAAAVQKRLQELEATQMFQIEKVSDAASVQDLAIPDKKDEEWKKDDWSDWKKDGWKDWEDDEKDGKMDAEETQLFEAVKKTQATRDDVLRILQLPSSEVLEEEDLGANYKSREETMLDLFVRVSVTWQGTKMFLVARVEGLEETEPYLVQDANKLGKSKFVTQKLRCRRGKHAKLFSVAFVSNSLIEEDEFENWLDWVKEEDSIPSPATLSYARQRLEESRSFNFDQVLIERLLERNEDKVKKMQVSHFAREAKNRQEALRAQLQGGLVSSREIPIISQQLKQATKDLADAREVVAERKESFEKNNTKLFGVCAVNNRNLARQIELDRAVALKAKDILVEKSRGREIEMNAFSRRDCKPVIMWDVGHGAQFAEINETKLQAKSETIERKLEKVAAGGLDKDKRNNVAQNARTKAKFTVIPGLQTKEEALEEVAPNPEMKSDKVAAPRVPTIPKPLEQKTEKDQKNVRDILHTIMAHNQQDKPKFLMPPPTSSESKNGVGKKMSFAEWKRNKMGKV